MVIVSHSDDTLSNSIRRKALMEVSLQRAESAGSNKPLQKDLSSPSKRRLDQLICSVSGNEASSSCNIHTARKHPRKVLRKMVKPPHTTFNAEASHPSAYDLEDPLIPQLLEVAADFALSARKDFHTSHYVYHECETISKKLWEKHQKSILPTEVKEILGVFHYQFKEYCRSMKVGVADVYFDFRSGEPCANSLDMGPYYGFSGLYKKVISNFRYLKVIYSGIWDYYFNGGNFTLSSSKRSRSTNRSGSRHSYSSVNDFGCAADVVRKIRKLFLLDVGAPFSSRFSRTICKYYYSNERACAEFMQYDDATAFNEFRSKVLLMEPSSN